jgi:hypothetical protein
MAIEKFRFVSPGVQINEIDDSIITPTPPAVGPVVIGRTAKGPAMQPVIVNSVGELEKVFGSTSNGNVGAADVWRSGVPTAPTFATYAAKAFLRNSSPVTVVRLAGVNTPAGETGNPGWSTNGAYELYSVSGSTAVLAGVIYTDAGYAVEVSNSVGGYSSANSGSYSSGGSLFISSSTGREEVPFSLVASSPIFLRNVLNTNPTKLADEGYFLGQSFENSLQTTVSAIYVTASTWNSFSGASSGSVSAETGWVTSDHASGADPTNLFKFVGLNSGASLSKDIKISIENVRASRNQNVTKYGTFDVVIRKLYESATETVLERFSGVSLDPNSADFIARRIGDSYRQWDATNSHYVEYGSYANRSAYVRVELPQNVTPAPTDLPHGFRMQGMPVVTGKVPGKTTTHAAIELLTSSVKLSAAKSTRFGLVSDVTSNADLVDILAAKSVAATLGAETLFSTRYMTSTSTAVQYDGVTYNSTDLLLNGTIFGFNMPLYGGFDGADITVAEPFVNFDLLDGNNETDSAAYRSIKQAIDIVSNPETIDMNVLCVPNLKEATLTSHMVSVCRARGDALAIIDLEGDYLYSWENNGTEARPTSTTDVITNLTNRAIDDSYGAAYFPAVFVASEGIFMPASIAALGAFGGTEGRSALWFAPAGFNRGGLTEGNAGIGVSRTALQLNASDRDDLYAVNINPIATFPSEGVLIFGQKTLQVTPSALDRVNVRRLLNYIKKQISRAATRVLFEPNIEATWNNFKGVVDPFLLAIKNAYGLDDAKVVLDSSTTTADLVDRNIMYCKIYVKPTRAIEYIGIDFVVTNSGAAFTE